MHLQLASYRGKPLVPRSDWDELIVTKSRSSFTGSRLSTRYICGPAGEKKQTALNLASPGKAKKQAICILTQKMCSYNMFSFSWTLNQSIPTKVELNVKLFTPRVIQTSKLVHWTFRCTLDLCISQM